MSWILHIEGIPGSGKSTGASQFNRCCLSNRLDSYWVAEEMADHPITPAGLRADSGSDGYAQLCLAAWRNFVIHNNRIAILDGFALQSTVRFLFANGVPDEQIMQYFEQWQQIGGSSTSLVFLRIADPETHFEHFVIPLRGEQWTTKLEAYVARTRFGIAHGLNGKNGLIEFWSEYQELCLKLLAGACIKVDIVDAHFDGWEASYLEALKTQLR